MIHAYLRRLNLDSPPAPDLAGLTLLQRRHQQAVPFENLDVFRRVPLSLDADDLADKILRRGRGGFCYELNFLFSRLLLELGFDFDLLSAGVTNDRGEPGPPFDHLCLAVRTEQGPHLCDVGFGRAPVAPLPLIPADTLDDAAGIFRFRSPIDEPGEFATANDAAWALDRFEPEDPRSDDDGWMSLYVFNLQPRKIEEFHERFLFHQTSPESPFPGSLQLTRATETGRIGIRDLSWTVIHDGKRSHGHFPGPEERRQQALRDFGIEIPAETGENKA